MIYLYTFVLAYLFGTVSPSRIVAKQVKGIDITKVNSKNPGTSNIAVSLGLKYAILVGVLDIAKGLIPVLVARIFYAENDIILFVAGTSAILGHIHPFYAITKGGKGTATFGGMVIGISPITSVIMGILFFVILNRSKYIALATLFVIVGYPLIYIFIFDFSYISIILISIFSLVSFYKHIPNFVNIYNKNEMGIDSIGKGVEEEV